MKMICRDAEGCPFIMCRRKREHDKMRVCEQLYKCRRMAEKLVKCIQVEPESEVEQ